MDQPPPTSPLATLTHCGAISTLMLNRPESRNALSIDLLAAVHTRLDELSLHHATNPITVLVIGGAGKAFCAGMDLKAVLDNADLATELLLSLAKLTLRLRHLPHITVTKVLGAAIGGGCGLAAVTDFAITHADSKMGYPEVDLGVCPAVVAPWLVRKIGAGAARHVLLKGGVMSGRDAYELGLVSHIVNLPEDLDHATNEFAKRLSRGGPKALAATKSLLNSLDGSMDEALLHKAAALSAQVLCTPEAQASLKAKLASA